MIRDIPNSCAVFLRMTEDMLWQEMSCSPNSVKGVVQGIIKGSMIGVMKGHIRSLNYSQMVDHSTRYLCLCA